MKRLIALSMFSAGLAIATTSCAHHQLSKSRAKDAALGTVVFAAVVAAAVLIPCTECKNTDFGTSGIARPPR